VRPFSRAPRRQRAGHRDEKGVALVIAVAVTTIFVTVSTSLAVTLVSNATNVEHGVLTASSNESASAGLNAAISTLQSDLTTSSSLPCSMSGSSSPSAKGQIKQSYSVTLSYYSSVNTAASPPTVSGAVTCTGSGISASSAAAVVMASTGNSGSGTTSKTMIDAIFSITSGSGSFAGGYGIYDESSGVFNNGAAIGTTSNTGTIFVNGATQCNSATINGPLIVNDPSDTGATTIGNPSNAGAYLENSCKINGTLTVSGDVVTNSSSPNVTGNATVKGLVTMNNSGNPIFSGNLTASGSVSPSTGTSYTSYYVHGTLTQSATVTLPTAPSMPILPWSSSSWSSAGWTVDNYTQSCGTWQNPTPLPTGPNNVYAELLTDAASTTPTVLYTSCAIQPPQNVTIQFKSNFALVDTNQSGMIFNADTLESSSSTPHDLYLIVPADPPSPTNPALYMSCGTSYEIQGENQESFGTTSNPLYTLVYDPCEVAFTNNGTLTGQMVVGGFGSLTNNFSFTYVNPGTAPGVANSQGSMTPLDQYVVSSS
jgi:hypothetical protein